MNLVDALLVLAGLLVATAGIGVLSLRLQNRARRQVSGEIVDPRRLGATVLGHEATLLQFSTETCSRCPGMHRMLAQIADQQDGVLHLDVDLTERPDIAKHFHVLQTPTTFILDRDGVIQTRFGGTPGRDVVELELSRITAGSVHA